MTMRAYLRQWIMAPCWMGEPVEDGKSLMVSFEGLRNRMKTQFTDALSPRVEYTSTPQPTAEEIIAELERWKARDWVYFPDPEMALEDAIRHLRYWLTTK